MLQTAGQFKRPATSQVPRTEPVGQLLAIANVKVDPICGALSAATPDIFV